MLDNIVERESTEWKIMCIIICYFILLSFLFCYWKMCTPCNILLNGGLNGNVVQMHLISKEEINTGNGE